VDIAGKTAVVTGGASGLGRATVERYVIGGVIPVWRIMPKS